MRSLVAILALSACISRETLAGESLTLEQQAKSLDSLITSVITCGDWSFQGKHGNYRIITGWLWGHSEIYVQWLMEAKWDKKKLQGNEQLGVPQVLATALFPDYDYYEAATDLNDIRCVKKQQHWIIEANADGNLGKEEEAKYLLAIELDDEPGKFTLTKQPTSSSK